MNGLSLCSGVGGIELGLSLVGGFRTVGYVEKDPYCQKVLRARIADGYLDDAPIWDDLRTFTVDAHCQLMYDCCEPDLQEAIMGTAKSPKYKEAVSLYEAGLSVGDLANYYVITRQAMWMILQRRGCSFRPNLKYGTDNHFYRGGVTASDRVHNLVEQAIIKGVLIPSPCEVCGEDGRMADGRRSVQAHHDDYNLPLVVRWLCQPHHHKWHADNTAIPVKEVMPNEAVLRACEVDVLTAGFP